MSPELVGLMGVFVMLFLLGTGMWIGLAMGIVGFLGVFCISGFEQALNMAGSIPYENISFYTLSVMPMFVLMGLIISQTGIGSDLFYSAHKCIGQFRGGLAQATVIACAFLSAISGTAWTGIIVFSKTALPEMRKYGYDDGLSAATVKQAQRRLSLSPLTLPHRLARVILCEQIYRAISVIRGEPYSR